MRCERIGVIIANAAHGQGLDGAVQAAKRPKVADAQNIVGLGERGRQRPGTVCRHGVAAER